MRILSQAGGLSFSWLVAVLLILATAACALSSPENLNDGKGTRNDPVPPRTYAHTPDYDVRALSVVWEKRDDTTSTDPQEMPLRVQYQIRCNEADDQVCRLEDLRNDIKLTDATGILYEPDFSMDIEDRLEGEILGDGQKTGWLGYRIPRGVDIVAAVAEYGQDQRVFFQLP